MQAVENLGDLKLSLLSLLSNQILVTDIESTDNRCSVVET